MKKREYLFDNYKAFLIVLVVISHFIDLNYKNNAFLYELKWMIVSFHMPAFIFISGYFAKKAPSLKKIVGGLIIPYFVYEIVYYLLYTFILHYETKLYFARPKFAMWYLMALVVWKLSAPWVKKIPWHMPILILAGLLAGYTEIGNFLSIPRILYFFPFFVAGMEFDGEKLKEIRTKRNFRAALGILAAFAVLLFIDPWHHGIDVKLFYGRYSYAVLGQGPMEGILLRILCYLIGFLFTYLFLVVIPNGKKRYSYLGERTMPVYIFHALTYSCFKLGTDLLPRVDTYLESGLLIVFCVGLVWLYSRKPFVKITDRIASLI